MKYFLISVLLIFFMSNVDAQIVVPPSTLPDVGEILEYSTFANYNDTISYRSHGEDLTWNFDTLTTTGVQEESYADINGTALGDSFPEANMIVNIGVFEAAAIKGDSTIEIIGITPFDLSALGVETSATFVDPYVLKKTPLQYGDQFEDDFNFGVQFSSDLIPGLDTIELPIPTASLDSVRVITTIYKSEKVTAWGRLNIMDESHDVLKIEQVDTISTKFELGISLLGIHFWIDASAIFGNSGFNLGQASKTYKFLSADSKLSIVEFTERQVQDTSGVSRTIVSGRLAKRLINATRHTAKTGDHLLIYPNPTSGEIRIKSLSENTTSGDVFIFNTQGQLLKLIPDYPLTRPLSLHTFPTGQYFIQVRSGKENGIAKIVLVR